MFPKFTIEDGFADDDPLWGLKESSDDVDDRATDILDSIFDDSNDDKNCNLRVFYFPKFYSNHSALILVVSITGHGGINSAILGIVGLDDLEKKVHHGGTLCFCNLSGGNSFRPDSCVLGVIPFICESS